MRGGGRRRGGRGKRDEGRRDEGRKDEGRRDEGRGEEEVRRAGSIQNLFQEKEFPYHCVMQLSSFFFFLGGIRNISFLSLVFVTSG